MVVEMNVSVNQIICIVSSTRLTVFRDAVLCMDVGNIRDPFGLSGMAFAKKLPDKAGEKKEQ